jgi:uncharacterized membrane protein
MSRLWRGIYFTLALAGFADAVYLTVKHVYQADAGCLITEGCDTVLKSEFATFMGIPLAYLGLAYYLIAVIGITAYHQSEKNDLLKGLFLLNLGGFSFSLWLVYLQAFVLNAFCTWCLFSALVTTLLLSILTFRKEVH